MVGQETVLWCSSVRSRLYEPLEDPILSECPEVPYALPPGRFENPVPLPPDFRYQDRDYITESSCQSNWFRVTQSLSTLTSRQTRYSPRTMAKLLVILVSADILEHLS